jgi:hypothetical protein
VTSDKPFVDEAGDQVLRFVSAARNLSRLGELTDEVVAIAQSGAWRRYRTAVGVDEWRECELDYFLIACDLRHEDISRLAAYTREGAALAPLMDRNANSDRRRTLEAAAATWHAPGQESLITRAQRLGWTRSEASRSLRAAPLPPRVRARQAHGMTMDEHAQQTRATRLSLVRRQELDELVGRLRAELSGEIERLYVIDQLRQPEREPRGRPSATEQERKQWRADAERLGWDAARLAQQWGVGRRAAEIRIRRLRQSA